MVHINLAPTLELHQDLIECFREVPGQFSRTLARGSERFSELGNRFESDKRLPLELSALLLDQHDIASLRTLVETCHELIERALDWLTESPERLASYFPEHKRVFAYLKKSPGLSTWQGYSRYDVIVGPDGSVKIAEFNTACPAGLLGGGTRISELVAEALSALGLDHGIDLKRFGSIPRDALITGLLEIEQAAQLAPELVAVLNDENCLMHELDLIADAMRRRGREVVVASAADLDFRGGRVAFRDRPVSLTYNKMRVSTEHSPSHHWKPGFENRYAGFLQGCLEGAMASVNNLGAMTIAEDKSLLGILLNPDVQPLFTKSEREFLAEHLLITARLEDAIARWGDESVDLAQFLRRHQERIVIKPANEGRGFAVTLGKFADQRTWDKACRPGAHLPCVVQEYFEPAKIPVVSHRGRNPRVVDMYLTLGLGVMRGAYQGIMSRISPNPVTNIAREGTVQAVFRVGNFK